MNKRTRNWLIISFSVVIIFTFTFSPIYYHLKYSRTDETILLSIDSIEITDCLENGTYALKASANKISYTKLLEEINGAQLSNITTSIKFTKNTRNFKQYDQNGYTLFLKLKKGTKSEVLNFYFSRSTTDYSWTGELWYDKFGGAIRIHYKSILLW